MKTRRTATEGDAVFRSIYRKLARSWGPQHWWPAETMFEVIVGAILAQNTSWRNVERALQALRSAGRLSLTGVGTLRLSRLEKLVRSSGCYRQKAQRLKTFVEYVGENYGGSLEKMFSAPTQQLRSELLALNGIGPETADAILLYAGRHEIFVVDAYARRVLERHAAIGSAAKYDDVRALVERALAQEKRIVRSPRSLRADAPPAHEPSPISTAQRSRLAQVYNEMHGFFVQLGKHYCYRVGPDCAHCPLREFLPKNSLPFELPESKLQL